MNDKVKAKKKIRYDLVLIGGIIVMAAIIFLIVWSNNNKGPSQIVSISVNGVDYETADLSKDQTITVQPEGSENENTLIIEDGGVHMDHASCPDQICIYQGTITKPGELIVCLPNGVIVEILNPEEGTSK